MKTAYITYRKEDTSGFERNIMNCYICKKPILHPHFFYKNMCECCGTLSVSFFDIWDILSLVIIIVSVITLYMIDYFMRHKQP